MAVGPPTGFRIIGGLRRFAQYASAGVASLLTTGKSVTASVSGQGSQSFGLVFSEGWESGTGAWGTDSPHARMVQVSASHDGNYGPHTGTYMAEGNWDGTVGGGGEYSTLTHGMDYTDEYLFRAWVRSDGDVDRVMGSKLYRQYEGSDGDFDVAMQFEVSNGPMWIVLAMPGQSVLTNDGGGVDFGDNLWHKFEIYLKHNIGGTNGILRIWIDDTSIINWTNIITKPTNAEGKWTRMDLLSNWSTNPGWEHDANNHVYYDDIEFYSDNATGGYGLMSDGTARTTP